MLNFDFLKAIPELASLHKLCYLCEQRQYPGPDSATINARKALEWLVKAILKHITCAKTIIKKLDLKNNKGLEDVSVPIN